MSGWRRRLGTAILAGLERRLPALTRLKAPEPLPVTLGMRRIYVLPTRFGLFLGLVLFGMLLTGLNYDNAPALLVTFFAGAYAFNAQFATVRNLHGLAAARRRGAAGVRGRGPRARGCAWPRPEDGRAPRSACGGDRRRPCSRSRRARSAGSPCRSRPSGAAGCPSASCG
ncbi:MAG: hypothetical protein RML12_06400 [Xanthomonadales bacterium]|nr:hypothetical protein [Xanthomonadales bacterium]